MEPLFGQSLENSDEGMVIQASYSVSGIPRASVSMTHSDMIISYSCGGSDRVATCLTQRSPMTI